MKRIMTPVSRDLMNIRALSETVEIYAGNGKHIIVHKSILTQEPFFEKCLHSGFQEGIKNVIRMPEDHAETVEDLVGYLYIGKASLDKYDIIRDFKMEGKEKDKVLKARVKMIKLYQLVEKIG